MAWELVAIKPGICARCGQSFCVEVRRGPADEDTPLTTIVKDVACRICGCVYSRDPVSAKEAA